MLFVNKKPDLAGGHKQSVRKEITHKERRLSGNIRVTSSDIRQYVMQIFSVTSTLIPLSPVTEQSNSSHMTNCTQVCCMIKPLSILKFTCSLLCLFSFLEIYFSFLKLIIHSISINTSTTWGDEKKLWSLLIRKQ